MMTQKAGSKTLFQIGKKIPENAIFPPEIDDIEKGLQVIDVAYHMNHRNAQKLPLFDPSREKKKMMLPGIGNYSYKKNLDQSMAIITFNNPYPCDFDRGIIDTMGQRFNSTAQVIHDDSKPCRKNGADSCTYIVTWKDL
ncbi:hypothetical protein [Candidatus Lokiarchaeum ossiferum]|uniref:hypothetical protein n=1 Tax=Candidatus Lokiarchaeum ossiferum TaxID=2951803 RepID=UPI00352D3E47